MRTTGLAAEVVLVKVVELVVFELLSAGCWLVEVEELFAVVLFELVVFCVPLLLVVVPVVVVEPLVV